jgi:hypothetical protein
MQLEGLDRAFVDNDCGILSPLPVIQDLISKKFDWLYAEALSGDE